MELRDLVAIQECEIINLRRSLRFIKISELMAEIEFLRSQIDGNDKTETLRAEIAEWERLYEALKIEMNEWKLKFEKRDSEYIELEMKYNELKNDSSFSSKIRDLEEALRREKSEHQVCISQYNASLE